MTSASTAGGIVYNNTFAADGTRQLDGILVTFDRPVDENTFTKDQVTIQYQNPYNTTGTVTSFNPTTIVPLDTTIYGTTQFLLQFTPQSLTGT